VLSTGAEVLSAEKGEDKGMCGDEGSGEQVEQGRLLYHAGSGGV